MDYNRNMVFAFRIFRFWVLNDIFCSAQIVKLIYIITDVIFIAIFGLNIKNTFIF